MGNWKRFICFICELIEGEWSEDTYKMAYIVVFNNKTSYYVVICKGVKYQQGNFIKLAIKSMK